MAHIKVTEWIDLYKRASSLLTTKYDKLTDWERDYLTSIYARKIVWGTSIQVQRIDEIEAKYKDK